MHLCHDSKEKLWGESEWWVCNNNRYLSDSAGVCGSKKLEGWNHREEPAKRIYTMYHTGATRHYNQGRNETHQDAKTYKVECAWPGEPGSWGRGGQEANNHTVHVTQLPRLPGSFMSQLRCALWRVFKGRRMHLMRPAWCDVYLFAQI